jgi:uncharacterized protein
LSTSVSAIHRGDVRGFLHSAPSPSAGTGVVLTHGAGGNCEMPLLVAVAGQLAAAGFTVLRCDLPFRQKRPRGAPSPATAAADRAGLREAVETLRGMAGDRIVLGGQSYGGRQASMLVAEGPDLAAALLLLSYPLHPPGQPEKLRTAHLPAIRVPALFVHGSRDPFGAPSELEKAIALIPAATRLSVVDRAGHDLARGRFDIDGLVVGPLRAILS